MGIIAALPSEGLHWGAGDTERIKMKRGQKKRWHGQHWGENASTVHRHQLKWKKKSIIFLTWLNQEKTEEKETMVCWTWGQWNQTQSATLSLSFLTVRLDFASEGKREDRLKSKVNQQAVQKKRTFECAGRFSDFFIKKWKEAKSRRKKKQVVFLWY